MALCSLTLLTITTLFQNIYAMDVAESNTGAVLAFPSVIDGPLYNQSYEVAPAQFGYQRYGGAMEGVLILPSNTSYHKECPSDSCSDCRQEAIDSNPYVHYIKDWFVGQNDITDYILLIDRLDCYFVDKIQLAQDMGASGVIMCDWRYENLFTMWMPQDWNDDIHIPSVLLQRRNCEKLMGHLGVDNWDPTNIQNTVYPDPEHMNWTIATIEWGLPHDDDRVEWELWTSSNDYLGSEFKHNFNTTAIMLDHNNDTIFTPHMYILNGSHWGCPTQHLPCRQQCTNSGRYCAVDPEYDLSIGLDGMDVIQENLRSLCVWEYDKAQRGIMDDVMWWDYAVLWDENCGVYSNSSMNFHVNCSFAQMDKLDRTNGLSDFVHNCINASGGYDYHSGENTILRSETKLKYNSSIYALPMIRVNEFLIHGNIDCVPPVTQHTCEVLAAICAGFIAGTQPDVCYLTPSPTIAHCNDTDKDCSGECHGHHQIDACNQCLLISDALWNECIGCNGQRNESYDCEGVCGGHYGVNPCGYCKDRRLAHYLTFGQDCAGVCDGTDKTDECGQCMAESNPLWNQCVGCDNTPNSGYSFNPCGRCIDSIRTDFNLFGKDCAGVCDGDKELDECNACLPLTDINWNSCIGCDGIANSGKSFNPCGRCIDLDSPKFNESGKDCRGICASSAADTYAMDECGQCLLQTDPEFNHCCGGDKNKQFNECGLCLYSNVTDFNQQGKDCQGTCNGNYIFDACGECLLATDPFFDNCMHCQDTNQTRDCLGICGGHHRINPCGQCLDPQLPHFNDTGKDCAGTCDGTKSIDQCNHCLESSSSDWNSCLGCDHIVNSDKRINSCGFCISNERSDFATYGQDCSGECDGNHQMDACSQCLLLTDTQWNGCIGCDGIANSGKVDNECGVCALHNDAQFNNYGKDCSGECARTPVTQHYIDECGQCLLPGDDTWNNCVGNNTNGNGNGNGNDNGQGQQNNSDTGSGTIDSGMILIIVIAIAAFIVIGCALIIIIYLCQKHREMKRAFDEIQKTYQPMDDIMPKNTTTRGMTSVADQEND